MSVKNTHISLNDFLSRAVENIELVKQGDVVAVYPSFDDLDADAEVKIPALTYRRNGSTTNLYLDGSQDYANIQYEVVIAAEAYDDIDTIEDALVETVMDEPDVISITGGTDVREVDTGVWVRSLLVQMRDVV